MKKFILLLLTLCCLLAACSTQDAPEPTQAPTDATEVIGTAAPTEAPTEVPAVYTPLPTTIDLNNLENCSVAVSLNEGDVCTDDNGVVQMKVTVYTYDLYDMVDIAMLEGGDTIVIRGENVVIEAMERREDGAVVINGGLDMGGYELYTDENTVYYENRYSDMKFWYEVGEIVLPVSKDFVYTDSSDLDKGSVTYSLDSFLAENSPIDYLFNPQSTTIVIENSVVISMERIYTP